MSLVALTSLERRGQAQLRLLLTFQGHRHRFGVTAVGIVHAVDGDASVRREAEEWADAIHPSSIARPRRQNRRG